MRAARLALVVVALTTACGSDSAEGPVANIRAMDFSFEPSEINVRAGSDVVVNLTNEGDTSHSFTAPDANIELDTPPGNTLTDSFSIPSGTDSIEFFCKYHPDQMRGTITVEGGTGGGGEPTPDTSESESDDGYRDY